MPVINIEDLTEKDKLKMEVEQLKKEVTLQREAVSEREAGSARRAPPTGRRLAAPSSAAAGGAPGGSGSGRGRGPGPGPAQGLQSGQGPGTSPLGPESQAGRRGETPVPRPGKGTKRSLGLRRAEPAVRGAGAAKGRALGAERAGHQPSGQGGGSGSAGGTRELRTAREEIKGVGGKPLLGAKRLSWLLDASSCHWSQQLSRLVTYSRAVRAGPGLPESASWLQHWTATSRVTQSSTDAGFVLPKTRDLDSAPCLCYYILELDDFRHALSPPLPQFPPACS